MKDKIFIDTNVLVYAFDESEPKKREIAKKIFKEVLTGEKKGVVSNQVLGELFCVLTKKVEKPIDSKIAKTIVQGITDSIHWEKVNYTEKTVCNAIETAINEKISFWDSLIIETMAENKIQNILTENKKDFTSKKVYAKNPFE